jgi:hypothetical protein
MGLLENLLGIEVKVTVRVFAAEKGLSAEGLAGRKSGGLTSIAYSTRHLMELSIEK